MQKITYAIKLTTLTLLFFASTNVHSFSTFSTAWDPGANTARFGGNPAPGGATWSIIGAGVLDDDGDGAHTIGGVTTSLSALNPALDIAAIINNAFDTWASVSGFTNLGQVADSGVNFGASESGSVSFGDIRIGAIDFDGPSGTLAHGFQPGTDAEFINGSIGGDIHLDNAEDWINGFDLATVLLHEIGHALGLAHTNVPNSVLNPTYNGVNLTLGADDIAGIQAIYGPSPAVVPLPAAPVLFFTAIGLAGLFRRKRVTITQ